MDVGWALELETSRDAQLDNEWVLTSVKQSGTELESELWVIPKDDVSSSQAILFALDLAATVLAWQEHLFDYLPADSRAT